MFKKLQIKVISVLFVLLVFLFGIYCGIDFYMLKKELKSEVLDKIVNTNDLSRANVKEGIVKVIEQKIVWSMVMVLVFFIVLLLFVAYVLKRWVVQPIAKIYSATKEVFYYGTKGGVNVKVFNNDEIGRLANSFNLMLNKMNETMVSKGYFDNIISNMSNALVVLDSSGKIELVNAEALAMLGYQERELIEKDIKSLFEKEEEIYNKINYTNLKKNKSLKEYETFLLNKSGGRVQVSMSCSLVRIEYENIEKIVCTFRNITEIKKAEEYINYQANYDQLTGLANRYYIEDELERLINAGKKEEKIHTFLYIDLDKFKIVNDICGHYAGDQLIKNLSEVIKKFIPVEYIIGRLGGDEFGIVLLNVRKEEGVQIAEEICSSIEQLHFCWEEKIFRLSVSIGAVVVECQKASVQWIMSVADRTCAMSKDKGGNCVQVFDWTNREVIERHDELYVMPSIAKAFEENKFFLEYQPIMSINSSEKNKWFEVLIRMLDEEGNVVPPDVFLPAAQRYNVLPAIDRWVIQHFFSTYKKNIQPLFQGEEVRFNINISGASLNTVDFFDFILFQMEYYDIPPEIICFEITETSAISNFSNVSNFISKLREKGCSFALDDFGSGLSSFSYLKQLPVDFVKIDGAFVKDIANNQVDYAIVNSINEIAHLMKLETIAEYVEEAETCECLRKIGINYIQGYLVGKPKKLQSYCSMV